MKVNFDLFMMFLCIIIFGTLGILEFIDVTEATMGMFISIIFWGSFYIVCKKKKDVNVLEDETNE